MARLAAVVYVTDESGNIRRYGPGDTVPAEMAKKITNAAAWDDFDGQPGTAASKADWVNYATSRGMAREEAEAATKQSLIDLYG